jgi:hypothetical protein
MKKYFLFISVICILSILFIDAFSQQAQIAKSGSMNASQSTPGQLRYDLDGKLLQKKGDPHVFWIDNGVRRHVESLDYVFLANAIEEYMDVYLIKEGVPITKDARLIQCSDKGEKNEGAIYLLDKGLKRHIQNMEVFNKYKFDMKKVVTIPCSVISAINDSDVLFK